MSPLSFEHRGFADDNEKHVSLLSVDHIDGMRP